MLSIRHVTETVGTASSSRARPRRFRTATVATFSFHRRIRRRPPSFRAGAHALGLVSVQLIGAPFVAINGVTADIGADVLVGALFELGQMAVPPSRSPSPMIARGQIRAHHRRQQLHSPRIPQPGRHAGADRSRCCGRSRLGRAGYATYVHVSARNNAARLDAAQKDFSAALAREANLRIGADVRARLTRAVYQVQLQDAQGSPGGGGTAWVIGPNLLATNAHVGAMRETLTPGERMTVRAPGEHGAVLEVVEHKIYPGYFPFRHFFGRTAFASRNIAATSQILKATATMSRI